MSLLASILQYLPGLGNAVGGFREGLTGEPASLAGTPSSMAGVNDRGLSGGDATWGELRQAGLLGGGASDQPAYVRQMPQMYQDQLRAIQQASQENERLYGGMGSWGGADQLLNVNRNRIADRQLAMMEKAQQAMFEREKFKAAQELEKMKAMAPIEAEKVKLGAYNMPGAFIQAISHARPDLTPQQWADAAAIAAQTNRDIGRGTYRPNIPLQSLVLPKPDNSPDPITSAIQRLSKSGWQPSEDTLFFG